MSVKISLKYTSNEEGLGWRSRYSDLLQTGRPGNRIPVRSRFFALIQTGAGVHPDPI
jgi:hypothetical protein